MADRYRKQYGDKSPHEVAQALAITIERVSGQGLESSTDTPGPCLAESNRDSNYLLLAYFEEPAKIVLMQDHLFKVQELLGESPDPRFSRLRLTDLVLAHELFHYFESLDPSLYSNSVRVSLFRLGPWTRKVQTLVASEIAAMAFAKRVLGLDFVPTIINYAAMYAYQPTVAEKTYRRMLAKAGPGP